MKTSSDPKAEYTRRFDERRVALESLEKRFELIAHLRLIVGVVGLGAGLLALSVDWFSVNWVALPLAAFITLVILHERTARARERTRFTVQYYQNALNRLDHTWQGTGVQRADFVSEDHPFAADLDLFGPASLFELMCTTRTRAGEESLARWLTEPASIEEIEARHEAVDELRLRLDFREDLAILGGGVRASVHPKKLIEWGEASPAFGGVPTLPLRIVAWCLSTGLLVSFVLWNATEVGPLPFWLFVFAVWGVSSRQGKRVTGVVGALEEPRRDLLVLSLVLERLEEEQVEASQLTGLRIAFTAGGLTASRSIRRLDRLIHWLDAGRNIMFAPIAYALMWRLHFALVIEAWRAKAGHVVRKWLEAVGEYETFCAIACYAYEHPADPYPELVEEGPLFTGDDLGHPLLSDDVCVRNTVHLGGGLRGWVVSGSNMSGKTTLLRTVGVNAVLAFAGAPVHARHLRISPINIGATIRLEDSLQAGKSRFYAEISRLKTLMDLTKKDQPLLFLLDEILHGTNSRDRQIGSEAIVRSFVDAGAIGLVTTHDLALARTADELGERVQNVHFEDRLEEGKLVFDYKVRPGVVQRGNALDLMRSVGLDV